MTIHEFENKDNPVIMLLPDAMRHWKGNFGGAIENLAQDFFVAVVAYTGFDESDTESYSSVTDELVKIEKASLRIQMVYLENFILKGKIFHTLTVKH